MNIRLMINPILSFFVLSQLTFADSGMNDHQNKMQMKMQGMDKVIVDIGSSSDGWKVRQGMKEHAVMMEEAINMIRAMVESQRKENEECVEREKNMPSDNKTCWEVETHTFTREKMIIDLLAHVIKRQNIMLNKMGILTESGK